MKYNTKTKLKIIDATIELINQKGIKDLTVREIVDFAGVNVATIKYHFGSKDALVNEVLSIIIKKLENLFDIFESTDLSALEKLQHFFYAYSTVALECPSVLINLITTQSMDYPVQFAMFLKGKGFEIIRKNVLEINPNCDERYLFVKFFQAISAIAFPTLILDKLVAVSEFPYHQDEARKLYTDLVVKSLLS